MEVNSYPSPCRIKQQHKDKKCADGLKTASTLLCVRSWIEPGPPGAPKETLGQRGVPVGLGAHDPAGYEPVVRALHRAHPGQLGALE